jgi:CHASE2 domain-containing sensor protein
MIFILLIMARPEFTPQPRRQIFYKVVVALLAAALVLLLHASGLFQNMELLALDQLFRWRGVRVPSAEIAIVEIDDATVEALGWPVTRDFYAALIGALQDFGAKVVAFDLLLDSPSTPEDDELLAAVTASVGNVIHAAYLTVADTSDGLLFDGAARDSAGIDSSLARFGFIMARSERFRFYRAAAADLPFPDLLQASQQIGHLSVVPDADGRVRRLPAMIEYQRRFIPALSLAVVQRYLEAPGSNFELSERADKLIIKRPPFGALAFPVNRHAEMMLNFYGDASAFPQRYTFFEVLQTYKARERGEIGPLQAKWFADKIVFVGNTVPGDFDSFATPFEAALPGVMLHATAASNFLQGNFVQPLSPLANWAIAVALIICIAFFPILLYILSKSIRPRNAASETTPASFGPLASLAMIRHFRIFNRMDLAIFSGGTFFLLLAVNVGGYWLFSQQQIWIKLLQINAGALFTFAGVLATDFLAAINERNQIDKYLQEKSSTAVETALAQQRHTGEVPYLRLLIFMLDFRGDYLLVHSIYRNRDDTALFKGFHPGRQEQEPFQVRKGLITKLQEEQKKLWEQYASYLHAVPGSPPLDLLKKIGKQIYQDLGLCQTFDKIFAAPEAEGLYIDFVVDLEIPWQWAYSKERDLFLCELVNCCTNFAVERY